MNNVMLDLETMGKTNHAAVVAIGACFFEPKTGEIGATFYQQIDLENSAKYGDMDASTVLWWLAQSEQARAEITQGEGCLLVDTLYDFTQWIEQIENYKQRKVWGNGAGFDCVILANAFKSAGIPTPWPHWNDRDVRTVVDLGRSIKGINPKYDMPFEGTKHNALDDAIHQAKYVSAIYQALAA